MMARPLPSHRVNSLTIVPQQTRTNQEWWISAVGLRFVIGRFQETCRLHGRIEGEDGRGLLRACIHGGMFTHTRPSGRDTGSCCAQQQRILASYMDEEND